MTPMPKYSEVMQDKRVKFVILAAITGLTIAIHYGWLTEWAFGHVHWIHALHSRFCYIPIVVAASWFGLRGGIYSATAISLLIIPYLFDANSDVHDLTLELVEIFFYYGIGILIGALVDRESQARHKHETTLLRLERSERLSLVGQMAAGVAHEIKNPLASIKGALEIVGDESVDRSARDEFRHIGLIEVKRIDSTIAEFLEFARPKVAKKVRLDLSASLENTVRQLQPQASKAGLHLRPSIDSGIIVLGDQEQLHQAVLNLLLNALEACETGDSICIGLSRSNGAGVTLTISDSGKGMTPDVLQQAFDPFFTTKTTGTGLGLPMVKSIIENHDGRITLASKPHGGTQVQIALPESKD
jgi:signal transduction histidine kinase